MCRKIPHILPAHEQVVLEISYILFEIPAHSGNFWRIPMGRHQLSYGFLI